MNHVGVLLWNSLTGTLSPYPMYVCTYGGLWPDITSQDRPYATFQQKSQGPNRQVGSKIGYSDPTPPYHATARPRRRCHEGMREPSYIGFCHTTEAIVEY
jgi:hypothetical protein